MARIFLFPVGLLRQLSQGAPSLHDSMAELMTVTGADPEVEIVRDASSEIEPPRWWVRVRAGRHTRHLVLDTASEDAMAAAVTLYLCDLVRDLQHELPHVFERSEIVAGVDHLVPWLRSKTRGEPS